MKRNVSLFAAPLAPGCEPVSRGAHLVTRVSNPCRRLGVPVAAIPTYILHHNAVND
jgi:hypothetical protein